MVRYYFFVVKLLPETFLELSFHPTPTLYAFKPSVPTDELWIGLNDQHNQMLFKWSDRSHVTFTQWQTGEPSHDTNQQEDCVLIRGEVKPELSDKDKMFSVDAVLCNPHLSLCDS